MNAAYELALSRLESKIQAALDLVGNIDGDHHKQWIIDQMVRVLTGDGYENWLAEYQHCGETTCDFHDGLSDAEYCDQGYSWDVGIAP